MTESGSRRAVLARRSVSVPSVILVAAAGTLTAPIWLPLVVAIDVVRLRWRLPLMRMGLFAVWWSWFETLGIGRAGFAWTTGRAADHDLHYELMDWWAGRLMQGLMWTGRMRPEIEGGTEIADGNAIVMSRHASLIDSLVSAWLLRCQLGLRPRYVLKRELLADPCLDIVGNRVPNHFIDRQASDMTDELATLRALSGGVGPGTVAVIFPEGTRATPSKRTRILEKIAETDPDRSEQLSALTWLLPPRSAGAAALLDGAPEADVALIWHTGFDGLDTFRGILHKLGSSQPPPRLVVRRVPRQAVPSGRDFERWLDEQWIRMDTEIDANMAANRRS